MTTTQEPHRREPPQGAGEGFEIPKGREEGFEITTEPATATAEASIDIVSDIDSDIVKKETQEESLTDIIVRKVMSNPCKYVLLDDIAREFNLSNEHARKLVYRRLLRNSFMYTKIGGMYISKCALPRIEVELKSFLYQMRKFYGVDNTIEARAIELLHELCREKKPRRIQYFAPLVKHVFPDAEIVRKWDGWYIKVKTEEVKELQNRYLRHVFCK